MNTTTFCTERDWGWQCGWAVVGIRKIRKYALTKVYGWQTKTVWFMVLPNVEQGRGETLILSGRYVVYRI